ncbi:MAG TPA: hypothetical protein VK483_18250 [Chitinophagaceae bacterium]|nr:hypothetical protein [Chitinophagaceae bacterium]
MKWRKIILFIIGGLLAVHLFALLILKDFHFKIFKKFYGSIGGAVEIIIPVCVVIIIVVSFLDATSKNRG